MVARLKIIDGKKYCNACKAWKDTSLFYPDRKAYTKLRSRCKDCDIKRTNDHHNSSLERALRNLLNRHHLNGKTSSKRRREFTENSCLTIQIMLELWSDQGGRCAVTGVPMTCLHGAGTVMTNASIDRIHPNIGYQDRSNIRLVCRAVNYMKVSMTDKELVQWCALVINGPIGQNSLE